MRIGKRLKRLYKKLQDHSLMISLVVTLFLFTITYFGTVHRFHVAESFRDALSRSLEDIQKGGKAHPYRTPDKWAVAFEKEPKLQINVGLSCTVTVIRGNSTEG